MEYNELVNNFAARFGVSDLEIKDGVCAFEIDGMRVAFIHDVGADTVTIYGEIGFPPPDANGKFGEMMLRANHLLSATDGSVLCQNPESGAYAIFRSFPLAQIDDEQFAASVEKLVNQTENWKQIVGGFQAAEQAVEDQAETLEQLPLGDFMRV